MKKYKLTEIKDKDGMQITYKWHPREIPPEIPVDQVYGFCNTPDNLVVLVREYNDIRFTPPGGGTEKGENALETLVREFLEEAQFAPQDIKLLGSLEVINPYAQEDVQKHNLQVRFVCKVDALKPYIPLQDGQTAERIFVPYKNLPDYVGFINKYTTGRIQYQMYCDYLEGKISL